jgi:drug/metabolite transporter (DMT)-like permease
VLGNLLALLNVTSYSIYLVISRGLLRRYDALTVVVAAAAVVSIVVFGHGGSGGRSAVSAIARLTPSIA